MDALLVFGGAMKKVLVLGGGIAGVECAIYLREYGFAVELISNRDYLFIYPISIWVPTQEYTFEDVQLDLHEVARLHGFQLTIDKALSMDASNKTVLLEKNGGKMDFDYLVVALGGGKMKHKGQENTCSICADPEASLLLRDKLQGLVQRGEGRIAVGFGGNPKDPSGVRGGPAFEFLFNLHAYLKKRKVRDKFSITLFAPMQNPGARLGDKALAMMDQMLKKLDIQKNVGKKIAEFQPDGVLFEDGQKLGADLVMFIAATDGHSAVLASDLPKNEAGFIKIEDSCQVVGLDSVYAIGDCAQIEGPDWRAKQGHLAEVMARNTAHNLAVREGKPGHILGYKKHLSIVCLMDMGSMGGGLVYRSGRRAFFLPLPFIGHTAKKLWGAQYKMVKLKQSPRVPGINS